MRESRTYGSVRGALSNARPYRDHKIVLPWLRIEHVRAQQRIARQRLGYAATFNADYRAVALKVKDGGDFGDSALIIGRCKVAMYFGDSALFVGQPADLGFRPVGDAVMDL
jgi:hypothetical protein